MCLYIFFFKQKTAYEMRISDWSSDVCSSDLDRIQKKFRPDASTPADPDWLLRKLNARLKALLDAEYARYQASAAAADASANAKTAEAEYKAFVQENGRRTAFLREAQDAQAPKESGSTPTTTSTAGSTRPPAPAANGTENGRGAGREKGCQYGKVEG